MMSIHERKVVESIFGTILCVIGFVLTYRGIIHGTSQLALGILIVAGLVLFLYFVYIPWLDRTEAKQEVKKRIM